MRGILLCFLTFSFFATSSPAQYDIYGGWTKIQGKKTGFFHTEQINGRWWLVTPEGNVFYSKGVETVTLSADRRNPPPDREKAERDMARRLKSWNFNTVGLWSVKLPGMPYFCHLGFAANFTPNMRLLGIAAAEYGRIIYEAIHKYDKNHLSPGSRFNSLALKQLTKALAPYYDVFSFYICDHRAPLYNLREKNRLSGKPAMVAEFSFKAMSSGFCNTIGAGDSVLIRQDRADLFTTYVQDLAALPFNVGNGCFRYRDQLKESQGRSPGGLGTENSNSGIVKINGEPWTLLVTRMTEVNGGIEDLADKA